MKSIFRSILPAVFFLPAVSMLNGLPAAPVSEPRSCVLLEAQTEQSLDGFPEVLPVAADFDGDGLDDLALADRLGLFRSTLTLLLGRGDGSFVPLESFDTVERQWAVTAGDFDGDGDVDLVTAHTDAVLFHPNRGDATFEESVSLTVPEGRNSFVLAVDVTGNERLDLLLVNASSSSMVLLVGLDEGLFAAPIEVDSEGALSTPVASDLDGDGDVDLAVLRSNSRLAVLRNEGQGVFSSAEPFDSGGEALHLAGADFDGDEDFDLVVGRRGGVTLLENDGTGVFTIGASHEASGDTKALVATDLNGDGYTDLAWSNGCSRCGHILINNGAGNFHEPPSVTVSLRDFVVEGDFDGDGGSDLAAITRSPAKLQGILTRPRGIELTVPSTRRVFQRDASGQATFVVEGFTPLHEATHVEIRAAVRPGFSGTTTEWLRTEALGVCESFSVALTVESGWYDVEVRALAGEEVLASGRNEQVGVGEVFVTAGQSNSIGGPRLELADERVSGFREFRWYPAGDPLGGGGPWGPAGELLARRLDVPVGFVNLGVGGTEVAGWLPTAGLYQRFLGAFALLGSTGFRGILWHQGESDAGLRTEVYAERLQAIIAQTRVDAGFDVPWGVALASVCGGSPSPTVIAGQQLVIDSDPLVFVGAATDELAGPDWRPDLCHFGERGVREHGRRWSVRVSEHFEFPSLPLRRGDVNLDGAVDLADPVALLGYLFRLEGSLRCQKSADADDSGHLNVVDVVRILRFQFEGPASLLPGGGTCLRDTTPDRLSCDTNEPCL